MLRQVDVEVGGALTLRAVVAERSRPSPGGHMLEHALAAFMDCVPCCERPLPGARPMVVRILVDGPGGLIEDGMHGGNVCPGVP